MATREQVEKQAAELAESCIAVRVRLLSRVVSGIYESRIRSSGVTIGQMNMLAAMINIGAEKASGVVLGSVLCMEKSTVSRNLDKMEENGWIVRREPSEGRVETLSVTASGRRVFSRAYEGWVEAQGEAEEELGAGLVSAIMDGVKVGAKRE